jgi:hypothetical protein
VAFNYKELMSTVNLEAQPGRGGLDEPDPWLADGKCRGGTQQTCGDTRQICTPAEPTCQNDTRICCEATKKERTEYGESRRAAEVSFLQEQLQQTLAQELSRE